MTFFARYGTLLMAALMAGLAGWYSGFFGGGPHPLHSLALGVAALACLLVPAAPARWRGNLKIVCFSTALSLLVGIVIYDKFIELRNDGTRLAAPKPLADKALESRLKEEVAQGDWRSKDEIVKELIAAGERDLNMSSGGIFNLLMAVDGGFNDGLLPLGGISLRTTVQCNEGGFWPVAKTDRYGFNNPDTAWDDSSRPRVLLVGDSFAYGSCVQPADTVASQLRQMGYAAVSVGIGGNGSLLEYATLREYGHVFRPRAIIWFHFDPHMVQRLVVLDINSGWGGEAYSPTLMNYLLGNTQSLATRQAQIDQSWPKIASQFDTYVQKLKEDPSFPESRLKRLNEIRIRLGMRPLSSTSERLSYDEGRQLLEFILGKARNESEGWGGKMFFALYTGIGKARLAKPNESFLEISRRVKELGFPLIDVDQAMGATPDIMANFPFHGYPTPFNSAGWGHYNSQGYHVFAEEIVKALRANGI